MADAVIVPGGAFGPTAGLLMYAGLAVERRGATVHRHEWTAPPPDPFQPGIEAWVRDDVTARLDDIPGRPLLIGKSLGTVAASVAADRALPAVWLTPLLTSPWVAAALERSADRVPFLLAGGTADALWDGDLARRLTPYVCEIDGADHGLTVPGPIAGTVAALGRLVTAIDEFLDAIGWPPPSPGSATRP